MQYKVNIPNIEHESEYNFYRKPHRRPQCLIHPENYISIIKAKFKQYRRILKLHNKCPGDVKLLCSVQEKRTICKGVNHTIIRKRVFYQKISSFSHKHKV